jgi:PAS domain S-box-containing protein
MEERQFTVLIAGGAPEGRAALRDALSLDPAARHSVIEAENDARALEMSRELKPDCLILDLRLGDISGLDVLKRLVAGEGASARAIVALVGEGDTRPAVEAVMSGARERLERNRAEGAELGQVVRRAIERAEDRSRGAAHDRDLAELMLQESKERLQLALEAADVGTWRVDLKTGLDTRDAALNRIIGLPEEPLTIPVTKWFEHLYPGDVSRAHEAWDRAMRTGVYDIEHRIVQPGGKVVWVRDRGRVFFGPDGEPLYATGAVADITARKQTEEASREKADLLDLTHDMIMVRDVNDVIVFWNRGAEEMYGWTQEDALGQVSHTLLRTKFPQPLEEIKAEVLRAGRWEGELIHTRRDGRPITVASRWTIKRDDEGRFVGTLEINNDITKRKQAEEALKKSAEEIHDLYNHAPCGYHSLDKDGVFVQINDTELSWLGYSREDMVGKMNFADLLTPESLRTFRAIFPRFKLEGAIQGLEFDLVRKDGTTLPVLLSATVHTDPDGHYRMSRAVVYDITERKRADDAIRESEARLRQLADAMPQIVYTCRPDGIVDYGNQRWFQEVGIPVEQSVGDKWMEALHPDDRERVRQQLKRQIRTGEPFETEYRLCRKDGEYRWYLSRGIPIRDGQGRILKWIGTATDIHDRKQAEAEREALLAREQAARALAEHAAESIRRLQAVTDSALGRLALEDLLREMLGRVRELLVADSAAILLLTEDGQSLAVRATIGFEDDLVGLRVPIGQGVAGSIAASLAPLVVEDLSTREVINPVLRRAARSLIGAPLIVEGRLIGVIHADMARVRQFTEDDVRLLQLAADRVALAIEQARLYEVERQARRQAEDANRMKDEFLALVSHELRSPLNAILGYASLLRCGGLDAQEAGRAAEVIERSGKAQAQLIDDLLDTARIISGKLRLDLGPVDLVSVIEEAVQTVRPAADAKNIALRATLPAEIGQITGDPARLQQVVWNLLSNAVKFTPKGGHVEARLERVDPHICITVSDTGKGISPDFLPFVFDRFRQADSSSARRYGGLGLGLSLVKYLVELHGGTVEAQSAGEGKGATFRVTLPVRAVATPLGDAGGAPGEVKSSQELAGVRTLVVDDEDVARELLKLTLEQYGADVVAASSATEAYALITESPPQDRFDVMVTDIGMPGEDGYGLVRRLREWERERDSYLPTVALTAYGRTEDRIRALRAGFQMHVAKPADPAELVLVIKTLIKRRNDGKKT